MAHSVVLTASGVVKAGSGSMFTIHVTKVATGAGTVQVFDNPAAGSGTVLWQGDGLAQGAFDTGNSNGDGLKASTGMFVVLGGTTNATVVVIYD